MAELSLLVKANFEQANAAFKNLVQDSEAAGKSVQDFAKKIANVDSDKFISKQKLLGAAMLAAGKDSEVLTAQTKNYQREIERLVKSGLDPESSGIKALQGELQTLIVRQENEASAAAAAGQKEKEYAAAIEAALSAAEQEADIIVKQLDAKSGLEKENIRLKQSQEDIKNEIRQLVAQGYKPESKEVQELEGKYKSLTKEIESNERAVKAQDQAVKVAKMSLLAIGAAIVGVGAFSIKAAADLEDMAAGFEPMLGSAKAATDLVKQIQKEAASTPFKIGAIGDSVKALLPAFKGSTEEAMKAFRMIGDTAQGNAQKLSTITSAYNKAMLTGKTDMKILNQIAGAGVPIYDELASSMGITVQEMMQMSKEGKLTAEDLTGAFQQMTGEGGIFFEGMDKAAYTFSSMVLGVKENLGILAATIGEKLLPFAKDLVEAVYNGIRSFTDWIKEGDNLKETVIAVGIALAGLTAGFAAFLIAFKGGAIIAAVTGAFHGLNAAIAANPIGAVAVVIAAVLIPALLLLLKNWDTVVLFFQTTIEKIKAAFSTIGPVIKAGFIAAIELVKAAFFSLVDVIYGNVLRAVAKLLEILGKIPGIGEKFQAASRAVGNLGNAMRSQAQESRNAAAEAIRLADQERANAAANLNAKLDAINRESAARKAALEEAKKDNAAAAGTEPAGTGSFDTDGREAARAAAGQEKVNKAKQDAARKGEEELTLTLQDELTKRLQILGDTEAQGQLAQQEQFRNLLQSRLDAEMEYRELDKEIQSMNWEEQKEFLAEQKSYILENALLTEEEKLNLNSAYNELLKQQQREYFKAQLEMMNSHLEVTGNFFNSMAELADAAGVHSRGLAVAQKAVMTAQAVMQTYAAANAALASGPPPWNFIQMAAVIAAGLANVIKITTTKIPSAETGGRFIVPESNRVDDKLYRFNGGEEIDVTPRGETGNGRPQSFIFKIGEQTIFDIVNHGLRTGDIVFDTAGNL
jgi:tape measure domain-containing protein